MEPISVQFKLSEQEFMAGARLLTFPTTEAKVRVAVSYIFFAIGLTLLLLAEEVPLISAAIAGIAIIGALAFILHHLRINLARRSFRGNHKFNDAVTLTFSDKYIHAQADQIDSKVGWKLYTDVRENETCYVLVYGKDVRMISVIPKRVFKREQEQAFRALLAAHFARKLSPRQSPASAPLENDYVPASLEPPDWR